jgi:hypothetical protein
MLLEIGPRPFALPLARSGPGLSEYQKANNAGLGGDGQKSPYGAASIVTLYGRRCGARAQITTA